MILYNTIKYIDQSSINNKQMYANIVRAQLTQDVYLGIFYLCLSRQGKDKFKPLVEKYALLKHLNLERGAARELQHLFDPGAFRRSSSQSPLPL
ncbi:putative phage abortive infection protein [Ancylobacter terrae]|uniref:putative phage abortive infection protein n=1 Tax=Ancylobacter sp. sgz301288 TaxID=3342077 RepID=UPI00385BAB4E